MRRVGRRAFLVAASAGVLGTAGCTSSLSGGESDGEIRPSGDPTVVPPPLECGDDSFERLEQPFREEELAWGDLQEPSVRLRVGSADYSLGEAATIELTNAGGSTVETGHRSKYSVQLRTEAGWQEVRGSGKDVAIVYPDVAIRHGSDEGFRWNLALTEDGLTDTFQARRVCPALQPGRYRFVYWGLPGEAAVGVAFAVE